MSKKKTSRKEWFIKFRSPIRWGFFGLLIAISLFCVEILLSLIQIYLSISRGSLVVDIFLMVLMAIAGLGMLLTWVMIIYLFFLWRHNPSEDDVLQIVRDNRNKIRMIRNDIKRIERGKEIG